MATNVGRALWFSCNYPFHRTTRWAFCAAAMYDGTRNTRFRLLHVFTCGPDPASLTTSLTYCSRPRLYSRMHQNARKRRPSSNKIKADRLLVIDEDGTNLGEMATVMASQIAESKQCKLIQMSPSRDGKAPVYRIMSNRTLYEDEKRRKKEANANKIKRKEIQITTTISDHDLTVKVEHIKELLQRRTRVTLCITPRRDRTGEATGTMKDRQRAMKERVIEEVKAYGVVQGKESVSARGVIALQLAPVVSQVEQSAEQEDNDSSTDSDT